MKTTEENNRMIAEFMGFVSTNSCIRDSETGKYYDFHGHNNFPCIKETEICIESEWGYGLVEADFLFISDLKFHTSWDWLMPVVEKISKTFVEWDYEDERRLKAEDIFYMDNMFSEFLQNDLDSVFSRVIQFIEWYNKQK